jgi:O-antigen/teichoic acid export membrane protein
MNLTHMVSRIMGIVGVRFAGAGIGFLTQLIMARIMPASDVGIVFMGMSAAAFVSLAASGGYSMLALTQLPKLALFERRSLLRAFHHLVLVDSLVMTLVCFLAIFAADRLMGFTEGQTIALLFGCFCAPSAGSIRYYSAIATSNRRFNAAFIPDFVVRPGILLAFVLFAFLAGHKPGTVEVLIVFTLASWSMAAVLAYQLRDVGVSLRGLSLPRGKFSKLLRSRAFALTLVAATLLAIADIVTLLAGFLLPAADVAVVGITMRLAALVAYVIQASQQFVMPDFTQAIVKGDGATADTLVARMNVMTLLLIGTALLGAFVLGEWLLGFFGSEYVRGASILVLFLVAQAVRALSGMNQHLLSIKGYQMRTAGACLTALLVLVLSAIMLTRIFGMEGMAYALLLAELTWLVLLAAQAQSLCGRRADLFWMLQKRLAKAQ